MVILVEFCLVIIYRRMSFDILKDRSIGNLWIINSDGTNHQKLTSIESSEYGAVWSPSGDRLAFVSSTEQGPEIYIYWNNSAKYARISQLNGSPSNLAWSLNGENLAFTMKVKTSPPVLVKMPKKPTGAKWAKTARITDRLYHEADGKGSRRTGTPASPPSPPPPRSDCEPSGCRVTTIRPLAVRCPTPRSRSGFDIISAIMEPFVQ